MASGTGITEDQAREEPFDVEVGDLIECVDRLITEMERSEHTSTHFEKDIEWLRERRRVWSSKEWRIGLLGVTSSGKSTLLNSLLGAEFLPRGVCPTSNCLVVCRKGERSRALIHYENRKPREESESSIRKALWEVGSEERNSSNRLRVKEVELSSSKFRLDPGIVVIDTPGLDAYGLEAHEELTLRYLLPSLDLVVFVTTVKANSDAQIKHFVEMVLSNDKPIILVQNMVDSVVPKLGPEGHQVKSKEDVAKEHLHRLRRLLDRTAAENAQQVPVIQVSANLALKGDGDSSGVTTLCEVVNEKIVQLSPRFEKYRWVQLGRFLNTIVLGEDMISTRQRKKMIEGEFERIRRKRNDIEDFLTRVKEQVPKFVDRVTVHFDRAEQQLGSTNTIGIEKAETAIHNLERQIRAVIQEFGDTSQNWFSTIREWGDELNLSQDDLSGCPSRIDRHSVCISCVTEIRQKSGGYAPPEGPINRLIHLFGKPIGKHWGQKPRPPVISRRVDLEKTRQKLRLEKSRQTGWLGEAGGTLENGLEQQIAQLKVELGRRESSLESKEREVCRQTEVLEALKRISRVREVISELCEEDNKKPDSWPDLKPLDHSAITSNEQGTMRVARSWLSLNTLACLRDDEMRSRQLGHVLKLTAAYGATPDRCFVWGLDREPAGQVVDRFWPEEDGDWAETSPGLFHVRRFGCSVVIRADTDETIVSNSNPTRAELVEHLGVNFVVFLLVDLSNLASYRKTLFTSPLISELRDSHQTIMVVDSVEQMKQSGELVEGFAEFERLVWEYSPVVRGCLVNDPNPAYTLAFHDLIFSNTKIKTLADENLWREKLTQICRPEGRVQNHIESLVRHVRPRRRLG